MTFVQSSSSDEELIIQSRRLEKHFTRNPLHGDTSKIPSQNEKMDGNIEAMVQKCSLLNPISQEMVIQEDVAFCEQFNHEDENLESSFESIPAGDKLSNEK